MKRRATKTAFIGATAAALMGMYTNAEAQSDFYYPVSGAFQSMPATECASPVGICTLGQLDGHVTGDYAFVMAELIPSKDESVPTVSFFTGSSLMATAFGTLAGTDTDALDLDPAGHSAFSTLLTLTDGADHLEGARAYLQIRGNLDFSTGAANGRYEDRICFN